MECKSFKNKNCLLCLKAHHNKRDNCPPMIEKTTACQLIYENGSLLKVRDITYHLDELSPDYKTKCKCSLPEEFLVPKKKKKKRPIISKCVCEKGEAPAQASLSVEPSFPTFQERRKEVRKGYDMFSAYKKQRQMLVNARIVDPRISESGKSAIPRPVWYQCISPERRDCLTDLSLAIYDDHCSGSTNKTAAILNYLGVYPRLRHKCITAALSNSTPNGFLKALLTAEEEYSWNQCLIMSAMCILEFPAICAQLKELTSDLTSAQYPKIPITLSSCLEHLSKDDKTVFECLSFPAIEIHPELLKYFQMMTEKKLSLNKKFIILTQAIKGLNSVRFAYKLKPIPYAGDTLYTWASVKALRNSNDRILKMFYDAFMRLRIESSMNVWMAFQPFNIFDEKMLQLFSSYLVTRYEKTFSR